MVFSALVSSTAVVAAVLAALKILKGEQDADILSTLLQSLGGGNGGGLLDLLGSLGKK